MSYETCESAGEKAIELDQDNRKKWEETGGGGGGGGGANKRTTKKTGWRSTPPRSPTKGFNGA